MMKVVQIHNQSVIKGGAEVYLNQLDSLLKKNNNESDIIFIEDHGEKLKLIHKGESKILHANSVINHIEVMLKDIQPQYVFIHNNFNIEIEKYLAKNFSVIKFAHSPVLICPGKDKYWRNSNRPCNIPMGLHCFYHIYKEGCSNRHPKRVFQAFNYANNVIELSKTSYCGIVIMSEWHRQLLLEKGIPNKKILLNPYFTEKISSHKKDDHNTKRLFFAGRLTPGKGVEELIEIVTPILQSNSNIFLDIVGTGSLEEKIIQNIRSKKIDQQVVMHGWKSRSQIKSILENAYLLIFPSTYPETFGIVGIEAQMFSLPAVAFNVGGISSWLKQERNGFLSDLGNIEEMRSNIIKLIEDKELYNVMSKNAYMDVNTEFIEEKHLEKLINFLKKNESSIIN